MSAAHRAAALFAVLLALAGCGSAPGGDEPPPRDGHRSAAGWRYDYAGTRTNAAFTDIVASSGDDAWAVGKTPVTGQVDDQRTFLFRYDGKTWRPYRLPPRLRRLDELPSVRLAGSGPRDVWLFAGVLTAPERSRPPLAAHWDGTAWRTVDLPEDFPQVVTDAVVVGPEDAWAVDGTATARHWDGRRWRAVRLPDRARALAGGPGRDLWAVGSTAADTGTAAPAAMRRDGDGWTRTPVPPLPPGPRDDPRSGELTGVHVLSTGQVLAFGDVTSEGGDTDAYSAGLALRWDGSRWQEDGLPCCVTGAAADTLFLGPKRYLTASGGKRHIAGPPCLPVRSRPRAEDRCARKPALAAYAPVPGTRHVWGVGSVSGGGALSRPVIVRLRAPS
ncbi:hypothetical protein AB0I16_32470 [Streptomyces sp. NPDC050703]|uniref:hypothetical protein n=1 Tax=Streptomyces sp. NPDC050703 TaxID=3157218 RepID=UPI003420D07E